MDPLASQTYAGLRAAGLSRRRIEEMVRSGGLIRVRRGRFVSAATPEAYRRAAELGGRLDCVSLLREHRIFVAAKGPLHLQITPGASRLPARDGLIRCHWKHTNAPDDRLGTEIVEALVQSCLCQPPRAAIATLDSAWHQGFVDEAGIADVFARLPLRLQALRPLLDPRSEAGTETFVRLMLRGLGHHVEVQARIDGVGRVDLLVDGWLIVECDSREFHEGWVKQREDRRRDLAAATRGYATIRPLAEDVLYRPDAVLEALRGLLATRATAAVHNSSDSSRKRRR